MKKLLTSILLILLIPCGLQAMEKAQSYCEEGGFVVNIQGLLSTTKVQRSFVSCTVTVYLAGTLTIATIYSDNAVAPTPKANPFTSASDGYWFFYAEGGKYDVRFSGSDVPLAFTRGDYQLCDPFGPNADTDCGVQSLGQHNLLSETHPDTAPYSPPEIGDLVRGNLNNLHERLGVAQVGEILALIDVGGGVPYPEWVWPSTLDTCTSVGDNGVEVGCEHQVNFIEGSNITMSFNDDSSNDRVDVTINATGAAGSCTDLTQVTDLYVSTAGNDTTGDGTAGLPWLTIQKAIDTGIPGIVCGRYIINLMVAGTYAGPVQLDGRIFAGGGGFADESYTYPIVNTTPVPAEYSWVEIRGDYTNTSTYLIDANGGVGVTVAGGNLTLTGLTVKDGTFGVHATKGAFVNLAAVTLLDNSVGVMGTEQSVIHIDNYYYVDDDGNENVLITNVAIPGVDGIEVADGSLLTDYLSDGNNTSTGAILHYDKGASTLAIGCIEMKYATMYFRGTISCEVYGIVALSSNLAVQTYDFNGNAPNTGTALSLRDSVMSGQVFGGGLYTITNAANAVSLQGASVVSPYPNIVTATTNFVADGGDTIPFNVRSRDTFMSTALLIDTLQFSATPAFNMNTNGAIKKMTLTANVTSSTITNQRPGEEITLIICQDGTGGWTFAWPANVRGEEAIGATLSTCNIQKFVYVQGETAWLAVSPMVKNQ